MKKIILVLVASICSFHLWSQGTLQLTSGASIQTSGNASIILHNMHIVNDGSFQQTGNGIVQLTGGLNVNLSGGGVTTINQLTMEKSGAATLNLLTNLSVLANVTFNGGLLNLNNSIIDLQTTGVFTSESESSRAFTSGSGYVQRTKELNAPSSDNIANLGAMISSTANLGTTIIRRGHAIQTGVSGSNNSIRRFYDIMPANNQNLKAVLRLSYFDAELNSIPEVSLHQWKTNNNINWDFVGANSRNTTANYVEKISINKFDRFTLATATPPTITCPANKTATANLMGCKASVSFVATATGVPAPVITYKIGNTVITSPHVFSKGTTTVTATASNGVAPNASCPFTVTVVCGGGPSITNATVPQHELQVSTNGFNAVAYPNPATNNFSITVQSALKEKIMMQVVDVYGRVIETRNVNAQTIARFGDRYRPGTYVVRIIQGKESKELKLVKLSE